MNFKYGYPYEDQKSDEYKKYFSKANTIKTYWYCCLNDDAYSMDWYPDIDYLAYEIVEDCCTSKSGCEVKYIGYKIFDSKNEEILDRVVNDVWFDRMGGGFMKRYLENVDNVTNSKRSNEDKHFEENVTK